MHPRMQAANLGSTFLPHFELSGWREELRAVRGTAGGGVQGGLRAGAGRGQRRRQPVSRRGGPPRALQAGMSLRPSAFRSTQCLWLLPLLLLTLKLLACVVNWWRCLSPEHACFEISGDGTLSVAFTEPVLLG